ncbi:MAG: PKD domain-containing protein, partial [bacterium]
MLLARPVLVRACTAFLLTLLVLSCANDNFQVPNIAPVSSWVVNPQTGTTETAFQFDASASSDAEDATSALAVRWDWENDGAWDTDWSAAKTASHQYVTAGTKTINLAVKDTDGGADDATGTVVVSMPNGAPVAWFDVAPSSGTVDTMFHFDASGCCDAEDTVAALEVRWDWEDDGTWDTDWSVSKPADHRYEAPGVKAVRLSVRDTGGGADDTVRTVAVLGPIAKFAVSPTSGTVDTLFRFDGSASCSVADSQSSLSARWDWEDDGRWDVPWSTAMTCDHRYYTAGVKTARLQVRDSCGVMDDTTSTVTVRGLPTARVRVSPSSGTTRTIFEFDASSSRDPVDGLDALEVRWDWESNGTWDTHWSTTKTASLRYSLHGTKTITLQIRNTVGLTDDDKVALVVSPGNTPPRASFTVIPTSGTVDTLFHFDASGSSDAQDSASALEVRWDWESDGAWDTEWCTAKTAIWTYVSPGYKTVRLGVRDTDGVTAEAVQAVTVASGDHSDGLPVSVEELARAVNEFGFGLF